MGIKTLVTAGLATLAFAAGATWGYVNYVNIFGGGCETSQCAPAPCCIQTPASAAEESCCETECAQPKCCETPSRQSAVAKE